MKCKKHPKYQAKKMPRADCKPCWEMWYKSPHRLIVNKYLGTPPGYSPFDEVDRKFLERLRDPNYGEQNDV